MTKILTKQDLILEYRFLLEKDYIIILNALPTFSFQYIYIYIYIYIYKEREKSNKQIKFPNLKTA